MSESDDTDVLLLIPPDVFRVPSSDSDSGLSDRARTGRGSSGVISDLVGHMQSLESRITAIESRDNSLDRLDVSAANDSSDSQRRSGTYRYYPHYRQRQTLPRAKKFSVSQSNSLQNTPVKPRRSLSVPSTPNGYSGNCTDSLRNDMRSLRYSPTLAVNSTNTNTPAARTKHDALTSNSVPLAVSSASCGTGLSLHATAMSAKEGSYPSLRLTDRCTNASNLCSKPYGSSHSKTPVSNLSDISIGQQCTRTRIVQEMDLAEVDELLREMEATELAKKIYEPIQSAPLTQTANNIDGQGREPQRRLSETNRKLDFQLYDKEAQFTDVLSAVAQKKLNNAFPDISLPYSGLFQLNETDKMISEFKMWEQNVQQSVPRSNGYATDSVNIKNTDRLSNVSSATVSNAKSKELAAEPNVLYTNETSRVPVQSKSSTVNTDSVSRISESIKLTGIKPLEAVQHNNMEHSLDFCKMPQSNGNLHNDKERSEFSKSTVHVGTNTDLHLRYVYLFFFYKISTISLFHFSYLFLFFLKKTRCSVSSKKIHY